MTSEVLLVLTTCDSPATAEAIAGALVGASIAACVNAIDGVRSTYRWEGRIERASETLLLIKTTAARYGEVEATIRANSSYELPEIVAVPLAKGLPEYLAWVGAQTDRE